MSPDPSSVRRRAEKGGRLAESIAALWLRLQGYSILMRRYKAPGGEIDIIARRGQVLAIVEVKARDSRDAIAWSVTPRQQRRIEQATLAYLSRVKKWSQLQIRFDVIGIRPWALPVHMKNAWQSSRTHW